MKRALLATVLALAGCSSSPTTVVLDVSYDATLMLDKLTVKVGDVTSDLDIRSDITLLLDDSAAGTTLTVTIDGLHGTTALARGQVDVTPRAHQETHATVELVALPGTVCQPDAADQCLDAPQPMCIDGTTLRTSSGPGTCVDNACQYEFVDTACAKGCVDNRCVCDIVSKNVAANIQIAQVIADRTFTVNGMATPDSSVNGVGSLFLRNAVTGDEIFWGSTTQASAPVAVLAGTYDVFYELSSAGSGAGGAVTVPRNKRARIATAVDLKSAKVVPLALTVVKADRVFRVNGATVPDSSANGIGNLFIRNVATGDEVFWGSTTSSTFALPVIAGTYDVFYELSSTGSGTGGVVTVPRNKRAKIATGASIMSAAPLDLSITSVKVDRTFAVDGSPVPDSLANGAGNLFLRNGATGDEIFWGSTTSSTNQVGVVAGTYDVFYELSTTGSGSGGVVTVPKNKKAKIVAGASFAAATTLPIDVTALKVDRTFTVNGATLTDSTVNGVGNLFIRNVATGDEVFWGTTLSASSPVQIVAGTYDVFYELSSTGSGAGGAVVVPKNKRARLVAGASLVNNVPLALAVTTVKIDRNFTVNGDALTDFTVNGSGNLFIRNVATGDEVFWGTTTTLSQPVTIISGTYDVFYEISNFGTGVGGAPLVPRNARAKLASQIGLTTTAPLQLATTVVKVDRNVTVNGQAVPDSFVNGVGNLFARNTAIPDEMSWSATTVTSSKVPMLAGTYDLFYELSQSGSGAGGAIVVPRNKRAALPQCIEVKQQ
jgi:hypothetical protein